ncbi:hypothetical protein HF521_012525 [Silurus meridionalis]|uniref:THUMP domain-containing protein 1 n=2 Tax=Silurus meridionalis TaxID=175797 RepID=A0A8T0ADI4_SILME|nr:hypothetical protein HF521_012525 [Silurus meridionalis]
MLPVCGSCKAFAEDMLKFLHSFLQPWFLSPNHASYQICFKSRNNNQSKRDDVIKSIAGLVNRLNPKNKVDLTDPELTIIIEVIKSVCCVSVIRDYKRFRKYNLQEVAKGPANQESPQQEVTKGTANQESPQQEVTKGPTNQESPQQEVAKGPANQESPQQEVTKGPTNQESSQQEVTKGPTNQESSQQEVTKDPANQNSPQQEVGKNEVNQGEQEVLKDLASQEQGQQEVTETEEQNVGGANGIKESKKE